MIRAEARSIYLGAETPNGINERAQDLIREGEFEIAAHLLELLTTGHLEQAYFKNWLVALVNLESYEKGLAKGRAYNLAYPHDADGHALTAMILTKTRDPKTQEYLDSLKTVFPHDSTI